MRVFSPGSSDNDPDSSPDALSGLARFLRQGVGQEWRAELEATEFETHQHRLRRRTLRDVAGMLLHRGDRLTVQAGGLRLSGQLTSGGQDYDSVFRKKAFALSR